MILTSKKAQLYPIEHSGTANVDIYLNGKNEETLTLVEFHFIPCESTQVLYISQSFERVNRFVFRRSDKRHFNFPFGWKDNKLIICNLEYGIEYEFYETTDTKLISYKICRPAPNQISQPDNLIKLPNKNLGNSKTA